MKLLINTAAVLKGGAVQVALSFIESCREFRDHEYHVVVSPALMKLIRPEAFESNFRFYPIGFRPGARVFSLSSHNLFFKELETKLKPDCVFTTSGPAYWRPRAPHLVGFNLPHHVYSDSPFFRSISLREKLKWRLKRLLHFHFFEREADALVAQTDDVANRLRAMFRRKPVFTVANTYNRYFDVTRRGDSLLPPSGGGEIRFLILSAYHRHKNFEIVNDVVPLLKSRGFHRIRFITTLERELALKVFDADVSDMIVNVGPIPVSECPNLYRDVDAVFLPSLLECFSANYPEAMVMRKPILTSDLGFARTVCGDAALYFNPMDPIDISNCLMRFIGDVDLRHSLIQKGLSRLQNFPSPLRRAEAYLSICRELVKRT